MSTGKENASVEEVECRRVSDSQVTQLPSKAAVGRLRGVLCDVECRLLSQSFQVAGFGGRSSSVRLCLLAVYTSKEFRLVDKLLLFLFF